MDTTNDEAVSVELGDALEAWATVGARLAEAIRHKGAPADELRAMAAELESGVERIRETSGRLSAIARDILVYRYPKLDRMLCESLEFSKTACKIAASTELAMRQQIGVA